MLCQVKTVGLISRSFLEPRNGAYLLLSLYINVLFNFCLEDHVIGDPVSGVSVIMFHHSSTKMLYK